MSCDYKDIDLWCQLLYCLIRFVLIERNANGERVYFTVKILFPRSDSLESVTLDIPLDLRYIISTMKWINFKRRGS